MKQYFTQFLLPLLLTCMQITIGAQESYSKFLETKNAKESLQRAQQFINEGKFKLAEKQLKHTIRIKDNFAIAHREMGRVSLELGKYEQAIEALETSFQLDRKLSRAALFECAEAYFKTNQVDSAFHFYQEYEKMKASAYANKAKESGLELTYDGLLAERRMNCDYLKNLDSTAVSAQPINLGARINSEDDEYLPTITADGLQIVFTRQKNEQDEDLMFSKVDGEGWSKSRNFGKAINTDKNEGMAKFETHGRTFYFAGCLREDTEGGCDIYKADIADGEIHQVIRAPGELNSDKWDSQPSITCDGTIMYFSSTRIEGHGGADIWMSRMQKNGEWSIPKNLGAAINTPGDEEAPFISSDGNTLYFTSTGHPGQGDGDLFICRKTNGIWSTPQNMGYPINSPAKEIGIFVQGNGKTAYFSSARSGGNGGLDIYKLDLPDKLKPEEMVHIEGFVHDKESGRGIPAKVKISREDQVWSIQADENGWFFLCLPGNKAYSFHVEVGGYELYIEAEYLLKQDNAAPLKVDIPLQHFDAPQTILAVNKIPEEHHQFFFDFDSHIINLKTKANLIRLVEKLKRETSWKVEVVGYADHVGDKGYNQLLSEKRADAVVEFLEEAGIKITNVVRHEGKGSLAMKGGGDNGQLGRRVDVVLRK